MAEAIAYSRENLAPYYEDHIEEMKEVMSILAFLPDKDFSLCQKWLGDGRWTFLSQLFSEALLEHYGIPKEAPLCAVLKCGIVGMKTPDCGGEDENESCPTCHNGLRVVVDQMPMAHHPVSQIVCRVTHRVMDEDNFPYALPNGRVYSTEVCEFA